MTDPTGDHAGEPADHTSDRTDDGDSDEGSIPSREHGIEFGAFAAALESHEFPTTARELVEEYGDHELGVPDGTESVREALGPYVERDDERRFDSPDDVQQAVLNMVGSDAVGREDYSDRGDHVSEGENESL